jgi:alpha-L-fucosidase 2
MLLQSQYGELELLPALPAAWAQGAVKGLCARGGFVVAMEWNAGKLTTCRVLSKNGGACTVRYKGKPLTRKLRKGEVWQPAFRN